MFKLHILDEIKLKKAKILLTGFHGLGSVGYIAVKHIIDELKAERIAVIRSRAAPPFIYLENVPTSGKPQIVLPFEFYVLDDILIFLPRLPPYRHLEQELAEAFVEWILSQKFDQIFLLGGVDKSLKTESESKQFIRYVPTRNAFDKFKDEDSILQNLLSNGLMIQGPLALMLGLLDLENKIALGVLAYAERERSDPEGAAHAIEVLNALIPKLSCSTDELIKNAKVYEDELKGFPPHDEPRHGPPETYS